MSHTAVPYTIRIASLSPLANMQRREEYRVIQGMGPKVRAGPWSSCAHRLDRARGGERQRRGWQASVCSRLHRDEPSMTEPRDKTAKRRRAEEALDEPL